MNNTFHTWLHEQQIILGIFCDQLTFFQQNKYYHCILTVTYKVQGTQGFDHHSQTHSSGLLLFISSSILLGNDEMYKQ